MNLVEKHIFKKTNKHWKELNDIIIKSKNVYNSDLYIWRQFYFQNKKYIKPKELYNQIKEKDCYKELPQNVSVKTHNMVLQNISSYYKAIKEYNKNPKKFLSKPRFPKYKNKFVAIYSYRVIRKKDFKKGFIGLTGLSFTITTKIKHYDSIKEARIVPQGTSIKIEIVYDKPVKKPIISDNIASGDIGINNLITIGFSDGKTPIIINGKPLKSINQFYNKTKANYQSQLKKGQYKSRKIEQLTEKRNNKIDDYMHKASSILINQLVSREISKLIIGKNPLWKQDINIGKKNNQKFTMIPFDRFINMIKYKCKLEGIDIITHEESYTSKCSFLDNEPIKKHENYLGKRIKRGLFKSFKGFLINADLNGAYNIMRKVVPNVFTNGIEGVVVHPKLISISI